MKVGTKSVLFGAHQFVLHPIVLAIAWWKLYGPPLDPRLWVAFIVHDLGYIGKANLDGPEGETHVELGARIMHFLFDRKRVMSFFSTDDPVEVADAMAQGYSAEIWESNGKRHFRGSAIRRSHYWHDFTLYHSRFYAKKHGAQVSPLCIADKMAIVVMPTWLWVTLCRLTGELDEYMLKAQQNREQESKYISMNIYDPNPYRFFENVKTYLRKWIEAHRRGEEDSWTPKT
jgi:hypothetical protein